MSLLRTRISLAAIAANTRRIAALVDPAELMAVVKADGYNHGASRVAHVMAANGADQFGVTTIREAVALRDAGITQPILAWLWTTEQDIAQCVERDIRLAVTSPQQARRVISSGLPFTVCVKVETGMHRNGVDREELHETLLALHRCPGVTVAGLFSHLSCADDPDNPEATDSQAARFHEAIRLARDLGLDVPENHLAASPAVLTRPDLREDMVRPGVALYGLEPVAGRCHGLIPAMEWISTVLSVKPVARGEGTSYGLTWRAPHDGWLAVVAGGYADGMSRSWQGKLEPLIRGRRYPQVGRVCMDQCVVFLGDNADGVQPGDEVVLFGAPPALTATELAQRSGTINYEVVCRPGGRTERQFVEERDDAPGPALNGAHPASSGADAAPGKRSAKSTAPLGVAAAASSGSLLGGEARPRTAEETRRVGAALGSQLAAGDVVILDGPLGAGKTTLTQGIAEGMRVSGRVTSPTFTIARVHEALCDGRPRLVHVDAYRIREASGDAVGELDALDVDSDLEDAVVVAEWGVGLVESLAGGRPYLLVTVDRSGALPQSEEESGDATGCEWAEDEPRRITWRTCWDKPTDVTGEGR